MQPLTSRPVPARWTVLAVAALAVAVFLAYLAGGRLGIGAADVDQVFSPSDPAALQSQLPSLDVPSDDAATPGALLGRAALFVAKGRRTALRDLAAVSTALTVAAFASALMFLRVRPLAALLASAAMAFGASAWSHGIAWHGSALDRSTDLVSAARSEFTSLGAFLALLGVFALVRSRKSHGARLIAIAILVAADVLMPHWPLALAGWMLIALALDWLLAEAPARSVRALIIAAAVVLIAAPAATRYRMWALGKDLPTILAEQSAYVLDPTAIPGAAAFISESRIVDATIALAARRSHRAIEIVPQSEDRLRALVDAGRPVFAMSNARANLEKLGFVFEPALIGNTPLHQLTGAVPCVDLNAGESGDVALLLAGGSFIVRGVRYGTAPGGVTIRVSGRQYARVVSIDPRSTAYDVADSAPNVNAAAVAEPEPITALHLPPPTRVDPVTVTLESAPLVARAVADEGAAVRICSGVMHAATLPQFADSSTLRMNAEAPFGPGWHPMEKDADFFRWTGAGAPHAGVRVSLPQPAAIAVTVTAAPAAPLAQHPTMMLTVNKCRFDEQPMTGNDDHTWVVPKECWRPGFNQLWIAALPLVSPATLFKSHDTRNLGARVSGNRLTRIRADQNAK
jgi:hypothetical protein